MAGNLKKNNALVIPTTYIYEIESIKERGLDKELLRNIFVHLYQDINNICLALNLKVSGYCFNEEFMNGKVLFPNPNLIKSNPVGRQIFQKTIICGALPNNTTITIPHNINVMFSYTFYDIYGCATNSTNLTFITLPYASCTAVANNVELWVDATNVYIKTGVDMSAFNMTNVILEYVKE